MTADEIIGQLGLRPHPEGGWYAETWRASDGPHPSGTAIYFLLKEGERSHWHRVDATEIWHFYAGDTLRLRIAASADGPCETRLLSPDLAIGRTQIIVPASWWQSAETTGVFTLVGCTVSPGFRFEGFELAPPGFDIH